MWQNVLDLQEDTDAAPNIGNFILEQSTIDWKESSQNLQGLGPLCEERQPAEGEGSHHGASQLNEQYEPLSFEAFFKALAK